MTTTAKRERQRAGRDARRRAELASRKRAARRRRFVTTLVIGVLLLGVLALIAYVGGNDDGEEETADSSSTTTSEASTTPPKAEPVAAGESITGETPCPAADGSAPRASSFEQAPPMCIDPAKTYTATFATSEGSFTATLDAANAPGTVNNFVVLSRYHYYDGTAIHRTDTSIEILQGGAPSTQDASDPGPGYTIQDEGNAQFTYTEGDLVMARSQGEDSAGAQFFIGAGPMVANLDFVDGSQGTGTYVPFGQVTEGLEVVKAILALHQADPTSTLGGAPSRVVTVDSVTITES